MTAILLRPATPEDAPLLVGWRNDPTTRLQSRRQHPLDWEQLTAAPPGTTRETYVGLRDGVPVGSIRLDQSSQGCELSWTVAPDHRGHGLGAALVAAAIALAPPGPLLAEIRVGNEPSRRIAAKLGFVQTGTHDGLEQWRMERAEGER